MYAHAVRTAYSPAYSAVRSIVNLAFMRRPLAHHVHLVNSSTATVDDLSGFHATAVHTALTVRLQGIDNSSSTTSTTATTSSASYDYTSGATTPVAASSGRNSGSFAAVQQALWASIRLDLMNQLTTASVTPASPATTANSTSKPALRVYAAADVHTGGMNVLLWRVDGSREGLLLHTDVTAVTVSSVTAASVTATTAVTAELSGLRVDALDSLSASDFELPLHDDAASRKLFEQVAHGSYTNASYTSSKGAESYNVDTPDYNNFNSGAGGSTASGVATSDNSPMGPSRSSSGHLFSSSIGSNSGVGSALFASTFSSANNTVFNSANSTSSNVFNSGTRPHSQQQQQQSAAAAAVVDTFILSAVTISLSQRTGSTAADAHQQQYGINSNVRSSNTAQRVLNVYEPRLVWNLSIRDRLSGLVDDLSKYKRAATTATTTASAGGAAGSCSPRNSSSDSAVFQDAVDSQQSCDDLANAAIDAAAAAAVTPR
eukprot:788-Heterococcus_DN1.PRE.2